MNHAQRVSFKQISKQKIKYINLYMQADKTNEHVRQTKT